MHQNQALSIVVPHVLDRAVFPFLAYAVVRLICVQRCTGVVGLNAHLAIGVNLRVQRLRSEFGAMLRSIVPCFRFAQPLSHRMLGLS